MKKCVQKLMSLLLALSMVFSLISVGASAASVVDSGTCGENLTWTLTSDGTLTISGTGDMEDYGYLEAEGAPWYDQWRESIKSVVLEDGITSIGFAAFVGCHNMINIEIPTSVIDIGDYTFWNCYSLTDITIPNHVTEIGERVFDTCTGLTSIIIPRNVVSIGTGAFADCTNLKSITIPAGIRSIDLWAFNRCENLTDVYYVGSESQWIAIDIVDAMHWTSGPKDITDIFEFISANIHFNSPDPTPAPTFTDVATTAYYAAPVSWAVANNVTNGLTDTTFGPEANCTRGQIVTFLWRAMGSPEPETTVNPFTDVKVSDYYYKAVLWAFETGVTTGATDTTFNPTGSCNRAQAVTFLWRAEGTPAASAAATSFTDVGSGSYYETAVSWAVANGITNGMTQTAFGPNEICNRGQIVTFLYRDLAE